MSVLEVAARTSIPSQWQLLPDQIRYRLLNSVDGRILLYPKESAVARPRSSTAPTTLYRLEGGMDLADYLVSLASSHIQTDRTVRIGDISGRVITGRLLSDQPTWSGHLYSLTGVNVDLPSNLPFAVLLIPVSPWTYALAWGAGHHLLDDELVEQGFGLMFGIRRLDPSRLGLMARSALDTTARHVLTSFPAGNDVRSFGLEPYGELVKQMAGPADLTNLTYGHDTGKQHRIKTGASLNVPLARAPEALLRDLVAIGDVVDQSDEHSALRFVGQVRALGRTHRRLFELERRLAYALGGDEQFGPLALAWPSAATREADEALSFKVLQLAANRPFILEAPVELGDLTRQFAEVPLVDRLGVLAAARMVPCLAQDGVDELTSPIGLRRWLTFETTINHVRYCYHQGDWFRIGEQFVEQIRDEVAAILAQRSALSFPLWTPTGLSDDENRYCRQVAKQSGYLSFDRNLATTPMHPKFELCDVLGANNELVHVKWLGRATAASHLFTQAQVSAESLRAEPDALRELNSRIASVAPNRVMPAGPTTVVLAAAGRRWDVDQLFSLSQLSLLRLERLLRYLGLRLEFADIPFVPKSKPRRSAA